jgi:fructose-1,6-bisphosphatase I
MNAINGFYCRAGGRKSIRRVGRIMEIQPTELHERVPFFLRQLQYGRKAEEFMYKEQHKY